jgi:hypothetical protein
MNGQLQGSLSVIERAPLPRYTFVLLLVVVAVVLVWTGWDEAAASASVLQNRIFLIGVALVFAVTALTLALVPLWGTARWWLIAAHLLIMGLYIGLAIATTDWTNWQLREWWQGWWTLPFMAGQIQQVLRLLRLGPSPLEGSLRPVNADS